MKRTFAKLLSLFVVLTLVIAMVPAVFAAGETVSAAKTTLKVGENTTISATARKGICRVINRVMSTAQLSVRRSV